MGKGRPKTSDPKEFTIRIRVTADELERINNYWLVHGYKSKSDLIRSCLKNVLDCNNGTENINMIVHGVEPPVSCIECPYLAEPEELYLPGMDGLYRKLSYCKLAPKTIDDPYRPLSWYVHGNIEAFCPIERKENKNEIEN